MAPVGENIEGFCFPWRLCGNAYSAFAFTAQQAAAQGAPRIVTVFRSARRQAFMGGRIGNPRRDLASFDILELGLCLKAAVRMSLASVGDAVAEFTGVPIGGLLSKVASFLILCKAETEWCGDICRLRNNRFVPHGLQWDQSVCSKRYVDDVLMVGSTNWIRWFLPAWYPSASKILTDYSQAW